MATCPGCVGRGTGPRCAMCGGDVPADKQRTPKSKPEARANCPRCRLGQIHSH